MTTDEHLSLTHIADTLRAVRDYLEKGQDYEAKELIGRVISTLDETDLKVSIGPIGPIWAKGRC